MTLLRAIAVAAVLLSTLPGVASGHAILDDTSPGRGDALDTPPEAIVFGFNEPVEASFGAVRVYDAQGERVDDGSLTRPGGRSDTVATRIADVNAEGTFTATYRLISADGHPISGGFVFSIGDPGAGPASTVSELVDSGSAGVVTDGVYGAVRALGYLAIALVLGGLVFLLAVAIPALGAAAGPEGRWRDAGAALVVRLRAVMVAAGVAGAVLGLLVLPLQAATATGESLFASLGTGTLEEVLGTRVGTATAIRAASFAAAAAILAFMLAGRRAPALEPAVGAAGLAPPTRPSVPALALLAAPLVVLALAPGLGGHAGTQDPRWVLIPANAVHVVAMSVWVGGLMLLLAALPVATRRLEPAERTRLLGAALRRFSGLALAAVVALALTGLIQAYVHVRTLDNLTSTAFGRAVLIKTILLLVLAAIGAWHRRRTLPALDLANQEGSAPGRAGAAVRRLIRAEVALVVAVLAVTSALVSYAPSIAETSGPFSTSTALGPLRLDMTVEPATAGSNEIHIYLTDATDGTQFDGTEELEVLLALPAKEIGPLEEDPRKSGPGHYVIPRAAFGVRGDWDVTVESRISEFDQYSAKVEVPIR